MCGHDLNYIYLSIALCFERGREKNFNNNIKTRLSECLLWKTRVEQKVLLALVEEKSITIQQPVDKLVVVVVSSDVRASRAPLMFMFQHQHFEDFPHVTGEFFLPFPSIICLNFEKFFSFPPPKHKTKISCRFLLTCLQLFEVNYSQIIPLELVDDLVMST